MRKSLILSALIGGMSPYLPFWRFDSASQPVAVAIVIFALSFVVIYPDEIKKNGGKEKMIETKMGEITLKGNKIELMADLGIIVRGIKEVIMNGSETEESAKQQINEAAKVALLNDKEFETLKKEKTKEIVKALFDGLLGGLFDEDKGE